MIVENLRFKSYKDIYMPREDSYMLAGAVEEHAFGRMLDMGTGSGIQGIVAAKKGCEVTFCDIDPSAIECAKSNAELNEAKGEFLVSDMFDKIKGRFDTIVFNPPYLPSNANRHLALDGGKEGRLYIDRFIKSYKEHINERHAVLLLESSFNDYDKDVARLHAKVVAKSHYFFEDLAVLLL